MLQLPLLAALVEALAKGSPLTIDPFSESALAQSLDTYAGFGLKTSGTPGDRASADWMAQELRRSGYEVERPGVEVPYFEAVTSRLRIGKESFDVRPQGLVTETVPQGLSAPLALWACGPTRPGSIAVVELPFGRHSSVKQPAIAEPVRAAVRAGAAAVLLVTHGPTGEVTALNAYADSKLVDVPVALIAPKIAEPVLDAARRRRPATLEITGRTERRVTEVTIGRVRRGSRWLCVSTPRTGWTQCAAERGPGVAAWIALAKWAIERFPDHSVYAVATGGHEWENAGSSVALAAAPGPAEVDVWAHLGAGLAAFDFHEIGDHRLLPLPSADPHRFLVGAEHQLPVLGRAFAGLPGLERPYPASMGAAGELGELLRAGYDRAFGVFSAHRFYHVDSDTPDKTSAALLRPVATAFRQAIENLVRQDARR